MKLLIDECIGRGIYENIKPHLDAASPPIQHTHILDFNQRQGVDDEEWVPRAAAEGWIVVTGDSGATKLGAPIQVIMPQFGVTGIYFSGKLQQRAASVKMAALLAVLDHLAVIEAAPKGTRFRLHMTTKGSFGLKLWPLTHRDPPQNPPDGAPA